MKYAIVEERLGFFLGSYEKYGLFAATDPSGIPKAYGFSSEKDATEYIKEFLNPRKGNWKVVSVETDNNDNYIDVIDLIKGGYSEYTHNMAMGLPMQSLAIH